MITRFRALLTIGFSHAYYAGACRDFDFVLPMSTAQLLRNGKLIAKAADGSLHVLFEADESGNPLKSMEGHRLRIGLKLLNPFFSNFTDLPVAPPVTALYGNVADPRAIGAAEGVDLVGDIFSHRVTGTARPVTVVLKDSESTVIRTDRITSAATGATTSYVLTGQGPGIYGVAESYPVDTKNISYYSDAELLATGIFGVVEVSLAAGFYTNPPAFKIQFKAREEVLKYYVVTHNYTDGEMNQLSILDNGFNEDGRPQVAFTKKNAASFATDDIEPGLLTGGAGKLVLFASLTKVARQEKGRKKIQLSKNGDVLVTHLPQPGADKGNSNMFITISKP
jgi:hypothetical protein